MSKWKKLLGIFMSGAVLITGGVLPQKSAVTAEDATDYGISSPRMENGVTTWDKIKFGSYYQYAEGQPAEPIKWRVLSVDGDDAFLLADRNLDCKRYNEKLVDVTWETCTLREWLNGDFYNEAFDVEEKEAVIETAVFNDDNPYYGTKGGNDTTDKVYLLSIEEVSNANYGFDTKFVDYSKTREAKNTDYAKLNGANTNFGYGLIGNGWWWLRSPGYSSSSASYVEYGGCGHNVGHSVHFSWNGVRPALHINLSSSKVTDAGEVDSEGNITMSGDGINNPTVKDGVTIWDCVYFGNYRQNFSKQGIEWRVLSVDGDDAFLLADKNLDCKPYDEEYKEDVTWETCTLRKWLNEDFYNEAFDDEEKKAVRETTVVNEDNPYWDTWGGNDTTDKIYLLSVAEASDEDYGFDTIFYGKSKTREAKNTEYVELNGARNSIDDDTAGKGLWWLRSPGNHSISAAFVDGDGYGVSIGNDVYDSGYGVRPALRINLSSFSWNKVGQVTAVRNSEGRPIESPESTKKPVDYGISSPRIENGVTTWDKIKFGSYYQDAEVQPAEPIKWRVLSVDGNDAFLLADSNLDCKPYNKELKAVTWGTCTLRKWLNEDFYNDAFDDEEKKAVIVNEDNPYEDKVYLLSIAEASNADYGFDKKFNNKSKAREARNTDYVKLNGAYSSTDDGTTGNGNWWVRSSGNSSNYASYVEDDGYGISIGSMNYSRCGVRPVLHINLSSSKVMDAGEINSEGNITMSGDGINNPTVKDGMTTWDCVYFGNYVQNCKLKKQDIEWRVLSVQGDDAFLLAEQILDAKPYNEKGENVTWEECTLRKWLNGAFYNEAFDAEEKEAVRENTVVNYDNPKHGTQGGNDITDRVYLLSIVEASNADYGFDTKFNKDSKTREAKNTDYAKLNGAYSSTDDGTVGNGYWWLRSPGEYRNSALVIRYGGYGSLDGKNVYISDGVRPAMHINLSSSLWSKAGEVSSVEQEDDKSTASPEATKEPTETEKPTASSEPTKEPAETDKPTASPEPTKEPVDTEKPTASLEPTDKSEETPNPTLQTEPTQTPSATAQPTPPSVATQTPAPTEAPVLKQFKLASVKCVKNTKKITGKVSVSKASVKIKVGKKAYKKASVKGKKFTLKLNYKLKSKTKITVKVEKKGYKKLIKSYMVK